MQNDKRKRSAVSAESDRSPNKAGILYTKIDRNKVKEWKIDNPKALVRVVYEKDQRSRKQFNEFVNNVIKLMMNFV